MVTRSNKINILTLSFGHGIVDLYANFLPALLPVFTASFALSRTRVGVLISIIGVSGSLCQVIYGYLGDNAPDEPDVTVEKFGNGGKGVYAIWEVTAALNELFTVWTKQVGPVNAVIGGFSLTPWERQSNHQGNYQQHGER